MANQPKTLNAEQINQLLTSLKARFEANENRHTGLAWEQVEKKLKDSPAKLYSLYKMEESGGEPDVVQYSADEYVFFDCSPETPAGRRNFCFDRKALDARKANKPQNTAMDVAAEMGSELLTEEQYKYLQTLGKFDLKTSSWIATPSAIRDLGGALFCDRRFDHVFVYHNGADSYYGVRGFRTSLTL